MIDQLPIAVRVYPDLTRAAADHPDRKRACLPDAKLVFDCETRIDEAQALMFGSYRFIVDGRCLQEGLFYADDLTRAERAILERYVRTDRADVDPRGVPAKRLRSDPVLRLLSREQFLELLYRTAYKGRALLVNFNTPFDLSRLACGYGNAQGRFLGGFSLAFWQYGKGRKKCLHPYRIRVAIKHIDSKRALKGFTGGKDPDEVDKIPEGSTTGKPENDYVFRGHILDLRTLAFALTDRGHSLETACELFGVEHGKTRPKRHGVITPEYIDYNRRDVQATAELAEKLLEEYERHPTGLQATKAYSPASIGKAYLRAMGIPPVMNRQPACPKERLGHAEAAFFGGRAGARIRKVPMPIVYLDFLSEYSTVKSLMNLWRCVIAREIRVVEHCETELEQMLREVTPQWVLDPKNWPRLTGFARVIPDGDVLPLRAKYGSNDWQIGANYVYAASDDLQDGLWYAWPDLVASVLLTRKVPRIVEAFKIAPIGQLDGLKPVLFRGQVPIDPRTDDFFRKVIEERQRLKKRTGVDAPERERLDKALKTFGSATSYGIFAEMLRQESDKKVRLTCYGPDGAYACSAAHPEEPGEYCFPPLAALVTSGGRLLLALLERLVTDRGGTYCMEDTDSMAIVATRTGGLVPCPGGRHRMKDGREAVHALSWEQVREIVALFAKLNPYDREAAPGSILKIERDNVDPTTGSQRQVWGYAISAKRYALFLRDKNGEPILLRKGVNNSDDRWSEHGLGHLLNPTDPGSEDREWIAQAWLRIIRKALGFRTKPPLFANLPAVGRTSVSGPWVMKSFKALNAGKDYREQIKPFNFLLSAHIAPFGHPSGVDPERFQLIAPFESNPTKWLRQPWIDLYATPPGERYRVTTSPIRGPKVAALMTYGDVLRAYEYHEEFKCAAPDGTPCTRQTVGLLERRHVRIGAVHPIGKESNLLEEVEAGQVHDIQGAYTEYPDPRRERDAWLKNVVPKLKAIPLPQLQRLTGLSRATLQAVRAGRMPHPKNCARLLEASPRLEGESRAPQGGQANILFDQTNIDSLGPPCYTDRARETSPMNSARPARTGAPAGRHKSPREPLKLRSKTMKTVKLPAIQLNQNGSRLILTKMRAADLADFTIVEAYRHDKPFDAPDQGYQRPAEIARVKQFANYLKRGLESTGRVRMPTAILLSGRGSDLSIGSDGTITLKSTNKLPLIDGQHRQRGFQFAIDEKHLFEFADYEVPVVIMQDVDKVEEMRQFATVNGTQKSVRTDLVNMILTQLASREGDDAIVSGQQWKVVVSRVVTRLNNDETGPWFDRVVMPDMSSYTKEEQAERPELRHRRIVRATSFMASLKPIEAYMADHWSEGKSLDERADQLFKPVDAFWRALRELNPIPFEQAADYVLLKTPGLFALHRVCFSIMKDMYAGRRAWDVENFKLMLKDGRLTEPDFWFAGTAREGGGEASKYGSMKGFAELADLLIDDLRDLKR